MGEPIIVMSTEQVRAFIREAVQECIGGGAPAARVDTPEIMTRAEVAKLLRIHPNYVAEYVKTKGLPGHKMGSEWRFLRSEVVAWAASHGKAA